jgi:hypothetical protein
MGRDPNRTLLLQSHHCAGSSWLARPAAGCDHRIKCQVMSITASFYKRLKHSPHADHCLFIGMPQEPRGQRWPTGRRRLTGKLGNFGSTHRHHLPASDQTGTRGHGILNVVWHAGSHGHG